mmetsp:Transcript_105809/g.146273  ORF Transcript_105809/g.146273 Transcript_105809/m.146273 type:complete len:133 (+) Transcript_105809:1383-1781(+)
MALILYIFPLYTEGTIMPFVDIGLVILTLVFMIFSMFKDPGTIRPPNSITFGNMLDEFDPILLCPDCNIIRTDRSRHCNVCNRCVERYDHHCPWINNCVGNNNHGYFMLFLTSIISLISLTFLTVVLHLDVY